MELDVNDTRRSHDKVYRVACMPMNPDGTEVGLALENMVKLLQFTLKGQFEPKVYIHC